MCKDRDSDFISGETDYISEDHRVSTKVKQLNIRDLTMAVIDRDYPAEK